MMDEEGVKPVLVRIVAADHSRAIDVLKVAFNAYAADIEGKLELPLTKTDLLKLLTD
ncbi:hypothetical protein [Sphingomonas sp.]|uniref:hypothetical protein n=1 Tax=Sphingomonas sp. TaxID=28214 RepID=UPI003F71592C